MFRFMGEHMGLKLVSVATAVALWLFVGTLRTPPEQSRMVMAEARPVNDAPADLIVSLKPEPVPVLVVGPRNEVEQIADGAVKALVDLSSARANATQLRITGYRLPDEARASRVEGQRQFVAAEIAEKARKRLRISASFTDSAPFGKVFASPRIAPAFAEVVGLAADIRRVGRLVVYADASAGGVRADLPIYPLDAEDVVVDAVRVEPAQAHVEIDLREAAATRTLVVSIRHLGRPAPTYELVDLSATPSQVTVTGPPSVLVGLTNIETEAVSVEGLRADTTRDVALRLPPQVSTEDGATTVRVGIGIREVARAP
ncbi:MAG TPA: CdaR family protein [Chthonomonadales bacterium]|nr:CdaR family protein [Chthonomonadales bacterium]